MRGAFVCVIIVLGWFTVVSPPARQASAQLPPEVTADRYLMRAERLVGEKDYGGALDLLDRIIDLQGKHALALPDTFHFRYAKVAWSAGVITGAIDALNRYLELAGTAGKYYREALALLEESEQIQTLLEGYQQELQQRMDEKDHAGASAR